MKRNSELCQRRLKRSFTGDLEPQLLRKRLTMKPHMQEETSEESSSLEASLTSNKYLNNNFLELISRENFKRKNKIDQTEYSYTPDYEELEQEIKSYVKMLKKKLSPKMHISQKPIFHSKTLDNSPKKSTYTIRSFPKINSQKCMQIPIKKTYKFTRIKKVTKPTKRKLFESPRPPKKYFSSPYLIGSFK